MYAWDEISFHSKRAITELDRALSATCDKAAQAHLDLSGLHLDQLRQLSRTTEFFR